MIKEFNSLEEIQKYYVEEINRYVFKEDDEYIKLVKFNFDLKVESTIDACNINACNIDALDIDACNINALDINAYDIYALDINARNINANDISYYAVCFAYNNIKCKSIQGRRENARHFVLDGEIEIKDGEN